MRDPRFRNWPSPNPVDDPSVPKRDWCVHFYGATRIAAWPGEAPFVPRPRRAGQSRGGSLVHVTGLLRSGLSAEDLEFEATETRRHAVLMKQPVVPTRAVIGWALIRALHRPDSPEALELRGRPASIRSHGPRPRGDAFPAPREGRSRPSLPQCPVIQNDKTGLYSARESGVACPSPWSYPRPFAGRAGR
jgi:hypothetical protein